MESVKKTQNKFLSEAKKETRGLIKATKQIIAVPKLKKIKHLIYFENYPPLKFEPVKYTKGLVVKRVKNK